jgi:transcriptional regulator with XRE-family HTH domain
VNEALRQALLRARLREDDIAAHLGVDPKTVRRWLNGRVPYPHNRSAIADLVGVDEADLWPGTGGPLAGRARPGELGVVYPHRWAIPRAVWTRFFGAAEQEIAILAYSALFLAEDEGILQILAARARVGVHVRIALGDPDSHHVAERGEEEGIGTAMSAKIRNALTLYATLRGIGNIEIRLHDAVLYNSIYRAGDHLMINQHSFGVPAAHSPVFELQQAGVDGMADAYLGSFERIWVKSRVWPHEGSRPLPKEGKTYMTKRASWFRAASGRSRTRDRRCRRRRGGRGSDHARFLSL